VGTPLKEDKRGLRMLRIEIEVLRQTAASWRRLRKVFELKLSRRTRFNRRGGVQPS
jgi:hypothetical protein